MKKLFITLVTCICIVTGVFFITRTKSSNITNASNIKDNNNINTTINNYDVFKMLKNIQNISNISLEIIAPEYPTYYIYIKDNLEKIVSDKGTQVWDRKNNTIKIYTPNSKEGIISKLPSQKPHNYYYTFCNDILVNMKNSTYEIVNDYIDGQECIKVIFNDQNYAIWFELENNLLIQKGNIDGSFATQFKNIKLNSVTDEDVSIPNDIVIKNKLNN